MNASCAFDPLAITFWFFSAKLVYARTILKNNFNPIKIKYYSMPLARLILRSLQEQRQFHSLQARGSLFNFSVIYFSSVLRTRSINSPGTLCLNIISAQMVRFVPTVPSNILDTVVDRID